MTGLKDLLTSTSHSHDGKIKSKKARQEGKKRISATLKARMENAKTRIKISLNTIEECCNTIMTPKEASAIKVVTAPGNIVYSVVQIVGGSICYVIDKTASCLVEKTHTPWLIALTIATGAKIGEFFVHTIENAIKAIVYFLHGAQFF